MTPEEFRLAFRNREFVVDWETDASNIGLARFAADAWGASYSELHYITGYTKGQYKFLAHSSNGNRFCLLNMGEKAKSKVKIISPKEFRQMILFGVAQDIDVEGLL